MDSTFEVNDRISAAARSVTGRRSHNEDAYCVERACGLYVVADGMGGYEGGEIASALAIETVRQFFLEHLEDEGITWPWGVDSGMSFTENMVCVAVRLAHRVVMERREGELQHMGSTVAMIAVRGEEVVIGHVGDSRVYRLRDNKLEQLTRDHSVYNDMRDQGIELGESARRQYKHMITRALGFARDDERPDLRREALAPGDVFLISSDGLHDVLSEDEIARVLAAKDPEQACAQLVEDAHDAGSQDNITAVVVAA